MKTRAFLPVVATLLATLTLPHYSFAQSPSVKAPNTNKSAKFKSIIVRGSGNFIGSNSIASFIGGGQSNTITSAFNGVIGGGIGNTATNWIATIGGGQLNTNTGVLATISGGQLNKASGDLATIGGGQLNTAGEKATIGGGVGNTGSSHHATIGGGNLNTATGDTSTISGGQLNTNSGWRATIGGGEANRVSGDWATVPGGVLARATNHGSFVWSGVDTAETVSTNNNSFTVRAPGGVRFITSATATNLVPINPILGVILLPGTTAWTALSDRESKTDFQPIKPREVLSKLAAMPVTSWQYKHDLSRRYIGPTSQDFMEAFHLGNYDKGINTLDADGVTFAAIQGLVEELKERDEAIKELKSELDAVKERLDSLPPTP